MAWGFGKKPAVAPTSRPASKQAPAASTPSPAPAGKVLERAGGVRSVSVDRGTIKDLRSAEGPIRKTPLKNEEHLVRLVQKAVAQALADGKSTDASALLEGSFGTAIRKAQQDVYNENDVKASGRCLLPLHNANSSKAKAPLENLVQNLHLAFGPGKAKPMKLQIVWVGQSDAPKK